MRGDRLVVENYYSSTRVAVKLRVRRDARTFKTFQAKVATPLVICHHRYDALVRDQKIMEMGSS